jgi:hypothetical protein
MGMRKQAKPTTAALVPKKRSASALVMDRHGSNSHPAPPLEQ